MKIFFVRSSHGSKSLFMVYSVVLHRLDKLTSGVLLLAKSQHMTVVFQQDLINHQVEKMYIARVIGNFPDGDIIVEKPIYCTCVKVGKYDYCENNEEEKILKDAKDAITAFKKRWYDETTNTSLVECNLKI